MRTGMPDLPHKPKKKKKAKPKTLIEALLLAGLSLPLIKAMMEALQEDEVLIDMLEHNERIKKKLAPYGIKPRVPHVPTGPPPPGESEKWRDEPEEPDAPRPIPPSPPAEEEPKSRQSRLNERPRMEGLWEAPQPDDPFFDVSPEVQKYLDRIPFEDRWFKMPVIYHTMQDSKVDDLICLPLEGRVFNVADEDRPWIPRDTHPNCRCWYTNAITGVKLGQI